MASALTLTGSQDNAARMIPPPTATDDEVLGAVTRIAARHSSVRRWHMLRGALNLWFYQGRHWIMPNNKLQPQGSMHTFSFSETFLRGTDKDFPRPVQNEVAPAVDNEMSMLLRKKFSPETAPTKDDPEYADAARLVKDLLEHDLEEQNWIEARHSNTFDLITAGTAIMRVLWDEPNGSESSMVPTENGSSVFCTGCGLALGSDTLPASAQMTGVPGMSQGLLHGDTIEQLDAQEDHGAEIRLKHCPLCEEQTELQKYVASEEEIKDGRQDPFGRSFGDMLPKGELLIENVNWWEYYPQNGGVGIEPRTAIQHCQRTPRSLDWIFDRYPHLEGKVFAEDPRELMRYHPTFGDEVFSSGRSYSATGDPDVYHNYAVVTEIHVDPIPGREGYEKGVSFVTIGAENDVVAQKSELCVEMREPNGEVRLVPRVKYAASRFRRVPGQFWGRTFVDDMIGPNRRLNRLDAMVEDLRERFSPMLVLPTGVELVARDDAGGSARLFEIESPGAPFDIRQSLFPGSPVTGNAYFNERTQLLEDLQRLGSPSDIETGKGAPGIKTTTGMMHLSEQTERRRAPREEELTSQYRTIWSAGIDMRWAFQTEASTFEKESASGIRQRKSYRGVDLLGQSAVKVIPKPGPESKMLIRELTAEAFQMQLYDLRSQVARNKVLENMGLPTDINEEVSIQVRRAEFLWNDFIKGQMVPPIDATLDDHGIFYAILGKEWQSDEAQELLAQVGWYSPQKPLMPDGSPAVQPVVDPETGEQVLAPMPEKPPILTQIAGWEWRLQLSVEIDAQQRAVYSGYPPDQWEQIGEVGAAKAEGTGETFPQPPEGGRFLPEMKEVQILMTWQSMGVDITNPWLKMRARIEAHRLILEEKAQAAMMGQAQAEEPGSPIDETQAEATA